MTDAERLLWHHLRRDVLGVRFRRQVPLGPFIVDFACFAARLVVEVDGGQHLESCRDSDRDRWLESQGFRVIRFWNHEVLQRTVEVLAEIDAKVSERKRPPTCPPPEPAQPPALGGGTLDRED